MPIHKRLRDYRPGDRVRVSEHAMRFYPNLRGRYENTVGTVLNFQNGVLTVEFPHRQSWWSNDDSIEPAIPKTDPTPIRNHVV